jgi:general secretion pathway protein L
MSETSIAWSEGKLALAGRWRAFGAWWLAGLREALPSSWTDWVHGEVASTLLLELNGDDIVCRVVPAARTVKLRMPAHKFGPAVIDACIAQHGLKRNQVLVAAVLKAQLFYQRRFSLPNAAMAALPRILEQDVLRRTPFPVSDIWHGAVPAHTADKPDANGVLSMRHWIIRKDLAEAALAKLGLCSSDIDLIAVSEQNIEPVPAIAFRVARQQDPAWVRPVLMWLIAAAVGTVLLGIAMFDWCQSNVAASLDASLAETRATGAGGGQASRLYALKADVGTLDVWDELSRSLPDHTFLTEMKIKDGKILISGYSADAARLVRLIDQSKIFTGAVLTSAITPDAVEHKDRFSISFNVRGRSARPLRDQGDDRD